MKQIKQCLKIFESVCRNRFQKKRLTLSNFTNQNPPAVHEENQRPPLKVQDLSSLR